MRGTGLWTCPWLLSLHLLLCVSGLQAVSIREMKVCLIEGDSLTLTCPYNIRKYALRPKAWQRVRSQGPPETLLSTEIGDTSTPNQVQAGRYLLEDLPTEAVVKVTVTGLQRQDEGLYQCVVDLSPSEPFVLHDRVRLSLCNGVSMLVIVLTCGFILNKSLVFSILFILLWKSRASGGPPNWVEQPHLPEVLRKRAALGLFPLRSPWVIGSVGPCGLLVLNQAFSSQNQVASYCISLEP
ncbi:PREDICTED: triggering receptor expressed on myeloid cells 1-like [Elephantulus edwardii]|uniref:triggering receptor expressed on myeloid cells 1-like n=1 Tax=Elephantulus edwardii TaxID=28737 RepID=UPI0003F08ECA|nr:PREDICTED: triggering receptor expressed on myeloid cells 1-like [Elephantulus edwardii]